MEILMSIHGKWADLIYQGKKTLELRKSRPNSAGYIDATVYIYNTDVKSIDGRMTVTEAFEVTEITDEICEKSCLSREEIQQYKGNCKLFAWVIVEVDEFEPNWLQLEDLGAKRAPQSWQYVHRRRNNHG